MAGLQNLSTQEYNSALAYIEQTNTAILKAKSLSIYTRVVESEDICSAFSTQLLFNYENELDESESNNANEKSIYLDNGFEFYYLPTFLSDICTNILDEVQKIQEVNVYGIILSELHRQIAEKAKYLQEQVNLLNLFTNLYEGLNSLDLRNTTIDVVDAQYEKFLVEAQRYDKQVISLELLSFDTSEC
ncbi:hypothetical protein JHD49_01525 [Sulfurimonas sp. SAG-AH-194-C21]|nr:hypothetical protein [Sulfurimonas sp. SAG-AH-194-C21]MDF1882615.1 hypothetical protein [Sulfurimonas sp. SAG-AH-194-C21]